MQNVKAYSRPRNDEFVASDCAQTIGATVNMSPINNREVVICYSSPQDHSVTRGFMEECAPTLNAAAGMSGNNRPFIVKKSHGMDPLASGDTAIDEEVSKCLTSANGRNGAGVLAICRKKPTGATFGIDQQGGKGHAAYTEDVAPTLCSDSHGTPHAVCRVAGTPIVLNFQGSKGNNVVSQDGACPTLNAMHGSDVHVVCIPINSMFIGKDGGNGDRQTFGIGEDGDACPTIQTAHHHAVAYRRGRA